MTNSIEPANFKPLKERLENNRVYFETIAATLLSLMAVIVAIAQTFTALEQNKLTRAQTEIATRQLERENKAAMARDTADWAELQKTIRRIVDSYPQGGVHELNSFSREQWAEWYQKISALLDSQTGNPVLISDTDSLGYWRNAISSAELVKHSSARNEGMHLQGRTAAAILQDIGFVWDRLILNSDQISATGGRPKTRSQEDPKTQR